MQNKAFWTWKFEGRKGRLKGRVLAMDPRDALSRMLTAETPAGRLFGDEHGIPVDVLIAAPGNADTTLEVAGDGFVIQLQKTDFQVQSVGLADVRHPYTKYSLSDAVELAVSSAKVFERPIPKTLEQVREHIKGMADRSGHNWLTGAAALDVLDAAIDDKDLSAGCRFR